jgi:hypothetical protein
MAGGIIAPAVTRPLLTASLFTGGRVGRRGGGAWAGAARMPTVAVASSA